MDSDTAERFVFDIKRFALHDGPGIRTTAFLKGCPLSCTWCHNPEGLKPAPLIWYSDSQCIRCWQCVKTCPPGALTIPENENAPLQYDREKCIHCGECVKTCPSGALHWDSRQYTVSELTDELLKDEIFHKSSGGGITISGGEPMNRPNFALKVLEACQAKGTHTAIETSLYAARETVDRFLPFVNLFLADLKLIDDETHRNCTGVGNKRIMENLAIIAQSTAARSTPEQPGMIVRVPPYTWNNRYREEHCGHSSVRFRTGRQCAGGTAEFQSSRGIKIPIPGPAIHTEINHCQENGTAIH